MDSDFSDFLDRLHVWLDQLADRGWIDHDRLRHLRNGGDASPEDLFAEQRPLIVAFFGGTGVGKSTLLNRLAGDTVARVGIERPTSREITVYLHRALPTERLRQHLPVEQLRIARHGNDNRRQVVWIDLPDFDSVEQTNRQLVLQCLSYVDVLVYVVSPERYRDDSGWRLLKEYGHRHAWLFVMNHWDEGCEAQIADFHTLLQEAGFTDPIVLRCDSRDDWVARKPDDFGKLEELLTHLLHSGGVEQLKSHALQQRQSRYRQEIQRLLDELATPDRVRELRHCWREIWRRTRCELEPALQEPIRALAEALAHRGKRTLPDHFEQEVLLRDLWVRKAFAAALGRLTVEGADLGLATVPLQECLQSCRKELNALLRRQIRQAMARIWACPGSTFRRFLLRTVATLRYLLPLGASGWVGWQVVVRYYQGSLGQESWLGVDFAVHSMLLIVLAWLVPFLLHRLLQPSLEKVAEVGIRTGIDGAFRAFESQVDETLADLQRELQELRDGGVQLLEMLEFYSSGRLGGVVDRMLV